MKLNIEGFSQVAQVELGIDVIDLVILRWFVDFKDCGKMVSEIYKNDKYYWIKYDALLNDLPGIYLTKYTMYAIGPAYSRLIYQKNPTPLDSKVDPRIDSKVDPRIDSKVDPKDHSIKTNYSIKTTSTNFVVDELSNKIENKLKVKINKKTLQHLLDTKGEIKILDYINNWDKFNSISKKNVAGFFVKAVQEEYEIPKQATASIPNMANFEQREYTAEDFEKYYYKVTE